MLDLSAVARKFGPFLFNQVDSYAAEPHTASDYTGSVAGFCVQHISYPQIDGPDSANTSSWNKIFIKGRVNTAVGCDGSEGDEETKYTINYAAEHVISVAWSDSTYCHGTPHGYFSVESENVVWDQGSRELTPTDVFVDGWKVRLQQLFWNAVLAKNWKPSSGGAKDDVLEAVVDPKQWSFTDNGLSVSFSAYIGGCYACNPDTTTVRWTDSRPLLITGSLLP